MVAPASFSPVVLRCYIAALTPPTTLPVLCLAGSLSSLIGGPDGGVSFRVIFPIFLLRRRYDDGAAVAAISFTATAWLLLQPVSDSICIASAAAHQFSDAPAARQRQRLAQVMRLCSSSFTLDSTPAASSSSGSISWLHPRQATTLWFLHASASTTTSSVLLNSVLINDSNRASNRDCASEPQRPFSDICVRLQQKQRSDTPALVTASATASEHQPFGSSC